MDQLDLDQRSPVALPGPGDSGAAHQPPDGDRALWAEFAQAASVKAFCRCWLALQCRMISGVSGGLVLLGTSDRGPFSPAAVWPDARQSLKYLTASAERALIERRGLLLRREPEGADGAPPRERYDVAYPIEVAGRLHGVVVLDVLPRPEPQLQAVLRRLHWGAAWLEVLVRREQSAGDAATKARLQAVLDLAATAVSHEGFFEATTAFVTAAATDLGCERVSVGFLRGDRIRIRSMSHSAEFADQTNLIRAIAAAMEEAIDQQGAVVYPAPPDGRPQVTRAHAELARQHGAGAICSVPLSAGTKHVGALTLERSAERPFDSPAVELCEALASLAGPVLEIQRREDRWLITKVGASLRDLVGKIIGPRDILLKLSLAAAAGLVLFLTFATGEYRVSATAALEPVVRRAVVAPFAGYIAEAPVRAGDLLRKDQVLASLDDNDLRLQRMKWASQLEQTSRQHQQALAQRNAAQIAILAAQMDQAQAEIALLDDQLARSRVRSAIDGIVVTGDLSQSLRAPVERGQVLFEVAPLDAFRVVLQVDERAIADVQVGQTGRLILSGIPGEEMPFRVAKITPVSTAKEGRNYFRVEATLERTSDRLRPGMEGVGKVVIDRRLLVWIWTHEVLDWVRLTLWSWLP